MSSNNATLSLTDSAACSLRTDSITLQALSICTGFSIPSTYCVVIFEIMSSIILFTNGWLVRGISFSLPILERASANILPILRLFDFRSWPVCHQCFDSVDGCAFVLKFRLLNHPRVDGSIVLRCPSKPYFSSSAFFFLIYWAACSGIARHCWCFLVPSSGSRYVTCSLQFKPLWYLIFCSCRPNF